MAKLPDAKELTGRKAAKVNGQEMLARALVKESAKRGPRRKAGARR
jgi:hypothetical protein